MVNPKKEWERKDNLTKLLFLLEKHKELTFGVLKEELRVSEPTLTEYIKTLEDKEKKIEHFFKLGDRKHKWYRIKPQNRQLVEAQLGKYEAITFIENLSKPIYVYEPMPNRKGAVAAFANIPSKPRQVVETILRGTVKGSTPILAKVSKLSKGEEIALVIMMSGNGDDKEGVES
jgi:DNA-binding Lrp family transcriptional regulator